MVNAIGMRFVFWGKFADGRIAIARRSMGRMAERERRGVRRRAGGTEWAPGQGGGATLSASWGTINASLSTGLPAPPTDATDDEDDERSDEGAAAVSGRPE